ncbi:aminoglycoside phosphotransferase (APT) family kinase protein [Nocardioides cavernae]|uniref:Aminoglycoside phosphotransferase (APT) family kinase protein n=1 Tax=Nocardioides cavernae TaxID=1921566 RepID=A0A7Y9H6C3_9ACTN|nr:aminoglycoside phosphotransferase family protein [Nocardioides cavernae]NYE38730.1 aminoglycoside phosphotransferase (APT) family kinase protein [Nocardioides cavernae]
MTSLGPSLTPLEGGHSGRTFLGEVAGQRVVVRLYPPDDARGESAPEVDEAVLRLVRGLLPVPEVLEVSRAHTGSDRPGLLVTSFEAGERGDLVHARLVAAGDDEGLVQWGRALGTVAATLAGMPTLRPGPFVDRDLTLGRFPEGGLVEWVGARLAHWRPGPRDALSAVAAAAQDLLDGVGRSCLVHSDLNPKNVLVDPATLEVTAVLDWEFAHSGHPWTDVGNLVRLERHPAYVDAVLAAWCALRGGEPEELFDGARAADLWALVDLAARAGENPVADRAAHLLAAVADAGDVHARPTGW